MKAISFDIGNVIQRDLLPVGQNQKALIEINSF